VALLYLALPSLVWLLLRRRQPQPQPRTCGAAERAGVLAAGACCWACAGTCPGTMSMQVANALLHVA
jgi:hypothetical protein